MPSTQIDIERNIEKVWEYFINTKNWDKWHKRELWRGIKEITPGWQDGATIAWRHGPKTCIRLVEAYRKIKMDWVYLDKTYAFIPLSENRTSIKLDIEPHQGVTFSDEGLNYIGRMNYQLRLLKKYIERETTMDKTSSLSVNKSGHKWPFLHIH
jgi:hypothetical protein